MDTREKLGAWIESKRIQSLIVGLILLNAVTLGLETSESATAEIGGLLHWLDRAILAVFVLEIGLKLYARGLGFFREPWNVFDFVVVGIALIPASGPLAVLRALRILRVLRLVSMVPRLRVRRGGAVAGGSRDLLHRPADADPLLCLRGHGHRNVRRKLPGVVRHHRPIPCTPCSRS